MAGLYAIWTGFALDLLLGDPRCLPHPVVGMGRAIAALERVLRRIFAPTERGERRAGIVLACFVPLSAFAMSFILLRVCDEIHPLLRYVAESWMCYQLFATKELYRQSTMVYRALKAEGLPAARNAVSQIVGRDTAALDAQGVIRAAVETIAENASDGVVAPLFYMLFGGAPLAMLYKAVNTMDSMVGYKNEKYLHFGRAAARLDDLLNAFPARLCALCMVVAAPLAGLAAGGAWRVWRRDRRKHASPNAGQPEAAMAGELGVQLAGDAAYFGVRVSKPYIGDAARPVEALDIPRANRLMLCGCIFAVALGTTLRAFIHLRAGGGIV